MLRLARLIEVEQLTNANAPPALLPALLAERRCAQGRERRPRARAARPPAPPPRPLPKERPCSSPGASSLPPSLTRTPGSGSGEMPASGPMATSPLEAGQTYEREGPPPRRR